MLVDGRYIVLFLCINLAGTEWGKIAKAIMTKDIKVVKSIKMSVSIFGIFVPTAIFIPGRNMSDCCLSHPSHFFFVRNRKKNCADKKSACECCEETCQTYFRSRRGNSQLFSDIQTVVSNKFSSHLLHATNAISHAILHLSHLYHAISHLSHAISHHTCPRPNLLRVR